MLFMIRKMATTKMKNLPVWKLKDNVYQVITKNKKNFYFFFYGGWRSEFFKICKCLAPGIDDVWHLELMMSGTWN